MSGKPSYTATPLSLADTRAASVFNGHNPRGASRAAKRNGETCAIRTLLTSSPEGAAPPTSMEIGK
jgi:hypothetical protein